MARNVEIKARISNIEKTRALAETLASAAPVEIHQDDTFFVSGTGRLKLRAFDKTRGELIFYRRTDQTGPAESFYLISSTTEPDTLREVLSAAHGLSGRVVKHRTLFMTGRTRIHLDRVEGLGDFLELEVVLQDGEDAGAGIDEAHALMTALGVMAHQLIDCAYIDLIHAAKRICTVEADEFDTLTKLWEASVRATHTFLSESDIQIFRAEIRNGYLKRANLRSYKTEAGLIQGFVGAANGKVEMLFIEPEARGLGIGKALLHYAIVEMGAHSVDVNEQNPNAVGFYTRQGFEVIGRSPLDSSGYPFPLLHMQWSKP